MSKYIVSLTAEGRKAKRSLELRSVLEAAPDVEILEGGRYAFTVEATASALVGLRKLTFAQVEPHSTLELLGGQQRSAAA